MPPTAHSAPTFHLLPAHHFTIEQLTAAYNQTRVDYLVPMPMNAARLQEYIETYDVDLPASIVAMDGAQMLGLGMLGVRPGRAWITRLGVLPVERRQGVGWGIMQALINQAETRGLALTILEVIKNNLPAYNLFLHCQFVEQRELLVLRRPPGSLPWACEGEVKWLDRNAVLALLRARADVATWLTETASYAHAPELYGLQVTLPDGQQGWLVFQEHHHRFLPSYLTRVMAHTQVGEAAQVGRALFAHLYHRYPDWDTHTENIPAQDPHLPAYLDAGYIESFRRIEMYRHASPEAPAA